MNNTLKIISIILLSLVVVTLSFFLYMLIKNDFKFDENFLKIFNNQSNTLIDNKEYDSVNNISIKSNTADIYINHATDNKFKVELYSDNEKKHSISLTDGNLNIELEEKQFSFFTKHARIILYVPSDFSNKFDIVNTTGDIKADSYENASFKVDVTTGDVKIDKADVLDIVTTTGDITNNYVNTISASCSTGDIKLDTVNKSLVLKTTTGDVKINYINLTEDSSIKTTTGDVTINKKENIYIETESKTGDVKIDNNDRFANTTLTIKVTTGDIKAS